MVLVAESKTTRGHYLDRCTSGLDWTGTVFKSEDCSDAVRALSETDARIPAQPNRVTRSKYDSHAARHTREEDSYFMVSKIVNLWVANRFNSKRGTCVVTVVMMQAFEPGTLPGEQLDPYGMPTYVSSFGEILLAAYQIEMDCLFRYHALGWWPLGKSHSTLSSIDAVLHKRESLTKSLRKKADSEALVSSSDLQNLTILVVLRREALPFINLCRA